MTAGYIDRDEFEKEVKKAAKGLRAAEKKQPKVVSHLKGRRESKRLSRELKDIAEREARAERTAKEARDRIDEVERLAQTAMHHAYVAAENRLRGESQRLETEALETVNRLGKAFRSEQRSLLEENADQIDGRVRDRLSAELAGFQREIEQVRAGVQSAVNRMGSELRAQQDASLENALAGRSNEIRDLHRSLDELKESVTGCANELLALRTAVDERLAAQDRRITQKFHLLEERLAEIKRPHREVEAEGRPEQARPAQELPEQSPRFAPSHSSSFPGD